METSLQLMMELVLDNMLHGVGVNMFKENQLSETTLYSD